MTAKGFRRCEYFDCGKAAVVGLKLEGVATDERGNSEEMAVALHYCADCYAIVAANEARSEAAYTELREQGCSEKMANHILLARMERER